MAHFQVLCPSFSCQTPAPTTANHHIKWEGMEFACDVVGVYQPYTERARTVDVAHEHKTRTHVLIPVHGSTRGNGQA